MHEVVWEFDRNGPELSWSFASYEEAFRFYRARVEEARKLPWALVRLYGSQPYPLKKYFKGVIAGIAFDEES